MIEEKTKLSGAESLETVNSFKHLWVSLKEWFFFLLRKWYVILIAGILGAILGISYAWLTKPKFESSLTFALEENGGGLGGALSLAAEFGLNLGGSKSIFAGDNILQIITSRRVIENVLLSVDSLELNGKKRTLAQYLIDLKKGDKKLDPKSRMSIVNFDVGKQRENFSYLEDSVLYVLYKIEILPNLLAFRPDKKLGTFEIRYTGTEERFVKIFTERLLQETTEFYIELRSKKSRQTLEVLENRVSALRGNLSSAISGRTAMQDANVNPAFAAAQAPLQQKQVDISAYSGAYAELFKNLELARFQYLQDVPLLQVIDDVKYPLEKIKKGRLMTGILVGFLFGIFSVAFLSLKYLVEK
jgi:uncharacterized protein involved in exopolysaccharide biosynthesis